MAASAPSGKAADPVTPVSDHPGHGHSAREVPLSRTGLRYSGRNLWALAAAVAGPIAAAGVLLPFRASWSNTNVALLLVVVVAAVAAAGSRLAGAVAAVGAAVWFDFFFTLPYYRLTISSRDDVTTAVLPLLTGLAVSQLAARARQLKVIAAIGEGGYLATMHGTAALAQASRSPEAVADYVGDLLADLLDLQEWRFEYGSLRSHPPRLESDRILDGQSTWDVGQMGLSAELELRVFGNGRLLTKVSRGRIRPPIGWAAVTGAGTVARVGFIVSLLIASLAFHGTELAKAKVGVLSAAVASSALTWIVFRVTALLPMRLRLLALLGTAETIIDLAVPVDPGRDHVRGPDDAPVTVVEYGDFECPYCGQAERVVRELLAGYGDLRYVWRHLPLTDVHPHAQLAAEATEAAANQGKFWEMHDRFLRHQDELTAMDLIRHAAELGLNADQFKRDMRKRAGQQQSSPTWTPPTSAACQGLRRFSSTVGGTMPLTTSAPSPPPSGRPESSSARPDPAPRSMTWRIFAHGDPRHQPGWSDRGEMSVRSADPSCPASLADGLMRPLMSLRFLVVMPVRAAEP